MPWKLVSADGQRSVPVGGRPVVVGRSVACDLSIQDPTVSRQHAEVEVATGGAGVRVRDLASTNGTFLNGERIWDAVAPSGSRIAFGKVPFEVREEEPTAILTPGIEDTPLDATILRKMPVQGTANIAARLSEEPQGTSRLRIGGQSPEDRQEKKLDLLIDIAKELSGQTDVDRLLDRIVDLTFQVMSVDRVAILMAGDEESLVPRISRQREDPTVIPASDGWRVPSAIARKTVQERVAVLLENVPVDLAGDGTILHHRVQSALCAPLLGGQGTLLGLIYLDNLGATHSFSEEDLEFLAAFSGMAAVALENSRLIEQARREAVVLSNFQRYFAPDLAEQIAGEAGSVRLGGTRRQVAVLFSDIRGFTSLAETMSPDDVAGLLTDYFTVMVEIVFEHGGTLDKFMGDALMALWGAPIARHDDADRSIRAAIAMQRALRRLNQDWRRRGRPTLSAGIGISAGDVFAGNIGSDRRLEYTVIGDTVNIAARLCSEAGPGEILVSGSLREALSNLPGLAELEPLSLRGKAHAVPVYRVDWLDSDHTQEQTPPDR